MSGSLLQFPLHHLSEVHMYWYLHTAPLSVERPTGDATIVASRSRLSLVLVPPYGMEVESNSRDWTGFGVSGPLVKGKGQWRESGQG